MIRTAAEWIQRQWRHASGCRAKARASLRGSWVTAVVVAELAAVLSSTSLESPRLRFAKDTILRVIVPENLESFLEGVCGLPMPAVQGICALLAAAGFLLHGALLVGRARYNLDLTDGKRGTVEALFSGFSGFRRALGMHLARETLLWLGGQLLIPGVIAYYALALTPYILAEDPDCTAWMALQRSWNMMRGHKLELCLMECSFFGWMCLNTLCGNIGSPILIPYMDAARAGFYRELTEAQKLQ